LALKLITLDLDNTLWETDPVILRAEQASFDSLIQLCPSVADLYDAQSLNQYRCDLAECYPDLRHQVSKLRLETLRRVCLQAGCHHDKAAELAQQAFDVFFEERSRIDLFDGALDALQWLNERYMLIALTNGNSDLEKVGIRHLFSEHYNAEQTGAAKPAPDLFMAALERAGVAAHECLHIGDHPQQDIDAARRLGFHTLWVNALGQRWPEAVEPPQWQLQDLQSLPSLVTRLAARLD
jgi:FMN hydrolase / 5-amino-6-(5-phospho-D-ribitylamino)uracil phosphatase